MVWFNPSNHLLPLNLVGGILWKTIQENEHFQLQQNKISSKLSAGTLLGDAVSSLRSLNPFDQGGAYIHSNIQQNSCRVCLCRDLESC